MATFAVNETARREQYISTGQATFNFNFQVNAASELQVYVNDNLQTDSVAYNATIGGTGSGSITFIDNSGSGGTNYTPSSGAYITIIGDLPLSRTTTFNTAADITTANLDTEFDNTLFRQQQLKEMMDRSIQLKVTTPRTVTGTGTNGPLNWPYDATPSNNASKVIAYNSSGTGLELGPTTANLNTLAGIVADISTVAGISSDVTTVAGNSSNINTVAGISSNVTTVAGISSDVTTTAGISSNITTVAGLSSEISALSGVSSSDLSTVAGISSEVTTVAGISANVTTVAGISSNVTAVAGNATNINAVNSNSTNINTVAANNTNITTVAGQISPTNNISTVAGVSSDISTVAGISSNVTTVASNNANVTTVAGSISNVNSVGTNIANVNTVAGNNTNVTTVAGSITNVNTVATNISDVNNFADTYRISATAPTTSLDIGDLWFDTTNNVMKVYSSSGWITAASAVNGTAARFKYTATGSQTTFTGADDNNNTLGYDAGFMDVYLNGIKLVSGSSNDYVATNGTSIVLNSGAAANDILEAIAYGTFELLSSDVGDLGNVNTTGLATNDLLRYDGTNFVPKSFDEITPSQSSNAGKFLTTDGTNSSWATVNTNLVADTTPQLGGDLDGNGNTIDLSGSTTELRLPRGTTAQQPTPSTANEGAIRYDTDDDVVYYSTGSSWIKIAAAVPSLTSVSGNIVENLQTTLTLNGTNFLAANLVVNFTQTSDSINSNVTVTPTSETAATVTVPAAVYNNVTVGNAVTIKVTNSDNIQSGAQNVTAIALPSGGTVTTSGNFRIHSFTSSGTFTNTVANLSGQYLVIAGGGGGGSTDGQQDDTGGAGGGGAGGYRCSVTSESSGGGASAESAATFGASNYTITVGAGGSGGTGTTNNTGATDGTDGNNSSIVGSGVSITSTGGGGGAKSTTSAFNGRSGGSGGGASGYSTSTSTGGSGTSGQGFAGASTTTGVGGGGGGAGEAGGTDNTAGDGSPFDGGDGVASSITGSSVTRAGGGASEQGGGGASGAAGDGGGGQSAQRNVQDAGDGTVNTGSGGGAGADSNNASEVNGGNGGSGIVIIRYDTTTL